MPLALLSVDLPEHLKLYAAEFNAMLPDKVEFDPITRGVTLKEPGSFGFRVASAFIGLIADINDVTANLNVVLYDLGLLVT